MNSTHLVAQAGEVIEFGTPKAEVAAFLMLVGLFTGMAIFLFVLLTRETAFRRELRDAFKRKLGLVPARKAFLMILPVWLLLVGFNYNRSLGDRFFGVKQEVKEGTTYWTFLYIFPGRERTVEDVDIAVWGGHEGWTRGMVRFSLEASLADGRILKSAFVPPHQFNDQAHRLNRMGADVALTASE